MRRNVGFEGSDFRISFEIPFKGLDFRIWAEILISGVWNLRFGSSFGLFLVSRVRISGFGPKPGFQGYGFQDLARIGVSGVWILGFGLKFMFQ